MSVEIVQAQLDAYNAQDLDGHCSYFIDEVTVANYNGKEMRRGISSYRDFHEELFSNFPRNRAHLLNRIIIGANVMDHERVDRGDGKPAFEVAAIYTLDGDKIARVDFIR